ncbi:MAG: HAD family phosphatase [Candidatus Fermentibacteraceae bacterium]|nr:HAD family phosphatase [Candidatus Fermentibacteraceae bacterium]MBN2608840.1 HAD family phosphatase [Candidatus Fermentibacteraceae bacterium]
MASFRGLFATDMDGTLLLPGGDFHRDDVLALKALGGMGVIRVIATGRSPFSFWRMMGERILPVDYLILSSGAGIMDYSTGEYLRLSSMDPERTDRFAGRLMGGSFDFCVQDAIPSNHVFRYCYQSGDNPDLERRIALYAGNCSPLTERDRGRPATQILVIVPPGKDGGQVMADLRGMLGEECSMLRTTSPLDGESLWIEIFPPGISKSTGVRWIAERHGLTGADSAAVGNDYNDHDLLEWAAHAFVVGDSPEHLRTAFTEVTSPRHGAVAHAARLWLIEKGQLSEHDSWPSP